MDRISELREYCVSTTYEVIERGIESAKCIEEFRFHHDKR